MLVHLCLSALFCLMSGIVCICTIIFELINDDDDDEILRLVAASWLKKNIGLAVYYLPNKVSFIHDNSKYLLCPAHTGDNIICRRIRRQSPFGLSEH